MINPFIKKQYIIYESPYSANDCKTPVNPSRIIDTENPDPNFNNTGYVALSQDHMDIVALENYISTELAKFVINVKIAKTCDVYGNGLILHPNLTFPSKCNSMFKEFSNESIQQIRNNIIGGTPLAYTSRLGEGNKIFDNLTYTDIYIQSKKTVNDKKPLCQRLADMNKMLEDFSQILEKVNTKEVKDAYTDTYDYIINTYMQNVNTRNQLEDRLKEIYDTERSVYGDSKLRLDSTIYTSVLWTILATTILFYVFKKM
jgi:hypothetical protein